MPVFGDRNKDDLFDTFDCLFKESGMSFAAFMAMVIEVLAVFSEYRFEEGDK